jgi:hypothetical protein
MNNSPCRKPDGPYLIESAPKLKQYCGSQNRPRNSATHLVAAVDLFCGRGWLSGRTAPSSRCRGDLSWRSQMNITPISVADQLDRQAENVSQAAALMNASAGYLRRAGPVIRAARLCVLNPAWSGVCDEDVMLEKALRDGGWI